MKDELISYETARVAKEKGFNLKVYNYFQIGTISRGVAEYSTKYINDINTTFKERAMFSRPTQSLLQRWLREKYNIHVNMKSYTIIVNDELESYHIVHVQHFKEEYKSYEEALEVGLLEGLKLI